MAVGLPATYSSRLHNMLAVRLQGWPRCKLARLTTCSQCCLCPTVDDACFQNLANSIMQSTCIKNLQTVANPTSGKAHVLSQCVGPECHRHCYMRLHIHGICQSSFWITNPVWSDISKKDCKAKKYERYCQAAAAK